MSINRKKKLIEAKPIPKPVGDRLDLKVGFACNNHCLFCVQGEKRKRYGRRDLAEIIDILEKNTSRSGVVFTGGEPTLHQDILEMVQRAKELGYYSIQIQTNGRMFAYRDFCRKVVDAGVTEISPALHGHTAALHEYLTNAKGSFSQTVAGIKNIKAMGLKVVTNTVINRSNFRNLVDISKLLVELGVDQYQLAFIHPVGSAGKEANFDMMVPRFELITSYVHAALEVGIRAGKVVMTEAIPLCFMRGFEQYVAEKIMPKTKIFDAEGVIEEYRNYRLEQGKSKGEPCKVCSCYDTCEGPWREYPDRYGWSEFHPIS